MTIYKLFGIEQRFSVFDKHITSGYRSDCCGVPKNYFKISVQMFISAFQIAKSNTKKNQENLDAVLELVWVIQQLETA